MKRILIEVVVAVILTAATWMVCQYVNGRENLVCMEEKEAMRQQWLAQQAEIDKVIYESRLKTSDSLLTVKDDKILLLQLKMVSDSIQSLSDLEAVRAINEYTVPR
ncbi:hypothetical protein [Spirosoma endophyticum]|uniref:Uncharacterized protein n=1 Tax=Spirosoma endophyticum TaxID=662367 RepID=A0A1I1SKA6_9BACT|nr:hypothetical protein [Spirosoma endophyticum]SFD46742.1 hypothetical protein SAMN05216167_105136 [Spirosoma endophyticum]